MNCGVSLMVVLVFERPCRELISTLMKIMRFDDKRTWDVHQFDDKFAPIREFFSMLDQVV